MSHPIAAKITGVAGYVPPKVMTNADLEKIVETNDEWIRTRTGIRERHVVESGVATSHMATEAAKAVLLQTRTDPAEIDLIVIASVTPDMFFPATACLVEGRFIPPARKPSRSVCTMSTRKGRRCLSTPYGECLKWRRACSKRTALLRTT